jgi:uncharacterized Ntn-hydrolase superfamily protein
MINCLHGKLTSLFFEHAMTFSVLARDDETGAIGGAAATGSLCVGGWVLRGNLNSGMSASQGAAPSTFWGEDVLAAMQSGLTAANAVNTITSADPGRAYRQLTALDLAGGAAAFTGEKNDDVKGSLAFPGGIVSGNMLGSESVLSALADAAAKPGQRSEMRLLEALRAAHAAGSDFRGILSAGLLVLHPDRPPLTLRIDHHDDDPIGALEHLFQRATTGDYGDWTRQVPVMSDKERILDCLGRARRSPAEQTCNLLRAGAGRNAVSFHIRAPRSD